MTKRVLTLDLSYMMSPAIHQYEDWVYGNWTSEVQQWEMMGKKLGWYPIPCRRRSEYLLRALQRALPSLKNKDQVLFVRHQHEILDHIDLKSHLVIDNVDQSHDIYYAGHTTPDVACDYNWVWWADRNGCLSSYRWFSNRNSVKYDNYMPLTCHFSYISDRRRMPMSDPDLVVICESPFWVPPQERALFRIMRREVDSYFQGAEYNENTKTDY